MTTATLIAGHKDTDGYWRNSRSGCCRSALVYYCPDAREYVQWFGYEDNRPEELRCYRCNKKIG